jgi:hypothetical protein
MIILAAGVGAWLGAMVFLSFAVAPTAFAMIESRHQAAEIVAVMLNVLYLSGYILGPALVLVSVLTRPFARPRLWGARTILLVLMTVSTVISREFVGQKLLSLRRAMGTMIEKIPADDPLRLLFRQWHQVSVLLMLFGIAAALLVLVLLYWEGSEGFLADPGKERS